MMNEYWIDLGLCAGLAIVLIASLAIFITIKIEIANLRRELTRNNGSSGQLSTEEQHTEHLRTRTQSETMMHRDAAWAAELKQHRAALAYMSNSMSSTNTSLSKDDALAALRRAWSAIPESVGSTAQ